MKFRALTTPSTPFAAPARPPYTPPRLTALGSWHALTLAISLPLGPGGSLPGTHDRQA